eukprot:TRINITY_DN6835_c0_g1_i1.p1 TRINITY_DN6835_c0_g1~~TRINITY_DN6835_c0_g1_i1.p1  ORF type:complete len:313 (-),score=22.55 TRINITY_DN6835_c0_g1_i1:108-1046(-)
MSSGHDIFLLSILIVGICIGGFLFGFLIWLICSRKRTRSSFEVPRTFTLEDSEVQVERLIGQGSFGKIYKGTWRGSPVAIKTLLPVKRGKSQLENEIHLIRTLSHENVVRFLGSLSYDDTPILITEYMERGSLHEILRSPEDLSWSLRKKIALDAARGLNFLHTQCPIIIHRDFKSHNLLLDEEWNAKICDFGLSRIIDATWPEERKNLTYCGSPCWVAPEVLRTEQYSAKVDVYSYGIVLWEMAARTEPYPSMDPFQIIYMVGSLGSRPQIPDCPMSWKILIQRCWDNNPTERPLFSDVITILEEIDYTGV